MIRCGAGGVIIGFGWSILTIGCFGSSGILIWGTMILGVSTFAIGGSFGFGGATLGLIGSGFF
jgi:hypothetical protein